jgi:hypothetical protein
VRRRIVVLLLVLGLVLMVLALAAPASADPGCQAFGRDDIAVLAKADPPGVGHIFSTIPRGAMPSAINVAKELCDF